jgi:fumarylpyruvate hydrolase
VTPRDDQWDSAVPTPRLPALDVRGSRFPFRVGRIWCVGRNYEDHAREMGAPPGPPEPPFFFAKPASALVPGGGDVAWPPATGELHHEIELVVAVRSGGRDLAAEDVLRHVHGYGVGIDLTRRDVQARAKAKGRPWTLAKGFDASAPCSSLRSPDEIGHPREGAILLAVNDLVRQEGDISEMIWSPAEILARLSREIRLLPGDLVFTGTPAGVGPLRPGDRVLGSVEGVGEIEIRIGDS